MFFSEKALLGEVVQLFKQFVQLCRKKVFFSISEYTVNLKMVMALLRPTIEIEVQEKLVFMSFFLGAIVCMGLSFTFHTVCCHKDKFIGQLNLT